MALSGSNSPGAKWRSAPSAYARAPSAGGCRPGGSGLPRSHLRAPAPSVSRRAGGRTEAAGDVRPTGSLSVVTRQLGREPPCGAGPRRGAQPRRQPLLGCDPGSPRPRQCRRAGCRSAHVTNPSTSTANPGPSVSDARVDTGTTPCRGTLAARDRPADRAHRRGLGTYADGQARRADPCRRAVADVRRLEQPDGHTGDLAWLGTYLRLLDPVGGGEPGSRHRPRRRGAPLDRPARRVRRSPGGAGLGGHSPWLRLERADAMFVCAAGLVEDDIRFGSLFASLQAPLRSRRPCVGLLNWLLGDATDEHALAPGRCTARPPRDRSRSATTTSRAPSGSYACPRRSPSCLRTGRIDEPRSRRTGLRPGVHLPRSEEIWVDPGAADQVARAARAARLRCSVRCRGPRARPQRPAHDARRARPPSSGGTCW